MAKKKEGSNAAYENTAEMLLQFVESIETLQADAKAVAEDIKDKFAEAKGRGFDTKALRVVIAERKKNAEEVQEFEAIVELYRTALGMGAYAPANGDDGDEPAGEDDGMV